MNKELIALCNYEACKNVFEKPVILLCCGESICEKHVPDLYVNEDKKLIKCPFCTEEFELPKKGLLINKKLEQMIHIDLGPANRQAKENIIELKRVLDDYSTLIQNPELFVFKYFQDIKNEIDISREEWKMLIDNYHDDLLKEINFHENECDFEKEKLKNDIGIEELNNQYEYLNSELSKFVIDESKWQELNNEITDKINLMKDQVSETKSLYLNNQSFEFKKPFFKNPSESLFGKIIKINQLDKDFDLISCSEDKTIKIWNLETGECHRSLGNHEHVVYDVKWISNEKIISCSADYTIKVWNYKTGDCLKTIKCNSYALRLKKLSNDEFISGHFNGEIKFWNLNIDMPTRTLAAYSRPLCGFILMPDRNHLISCSFDGNLKIWDLVSLHCLHTIQSQFEITDIKALANTEDVIGCSTTGKIIKFDIKSLTSEEFLSAFDKQLWSLEILPENKFVTGSHGHTIRIWDSNVKKCLGILTGHINQISSLKYLNKNKLISGSHDKTIKLWNLDTMECIRTFTGHEGFIWEFELIGKIK